MAEINFPKGIFVKRPHEKAPLFIKARISIKLSEAIDWLKQQPGEYINLDLKNSREGKLYLQVDEWKPEAKPEAKSESANYSASSPDIPSDDLPY